MPQTRHLVPQKRPRRLRKGLVLCTLAKGRQDTRRGRGAKVGKRCDRASTSHDNNESWESPHELYGQQGKEGVK